MSVQGKLKMKRQDLEELRGRRSRGLDNENSMVKFMKVTRLFPLVRGAVSGRFPQSGRWCRGGLGPQGSVGRVPQGWKPEYPSTDEWIKKMWYITQNEIMPFAATWSNIDGPRDYHTK